MTRTQLSFLAAFVATTVACGSNNSNPASPTPPGAPGPSGATITIQANGTLNPSQVDITVGQSVTIVNLDSRSHEIASDPHPSHSDCPQFDVLVAAGQTKLSNALPVAKTCGFHDHLDPANPNLLGRVIVH